MLAVPQSRECYWEYGSADGKDNTAVSDHPVRRGVLRDIEEMERLMDNIFSFELSHAGTHTPVSGSYFACLIHPALGECPGG